MKVFELIEQLKSMPQDAEVIVRGYEDGVNKADLLLPCDIVPFKETGQFGKWAKAGANGEENPYWNGRYKTCGEGEGEGSEKAVFIRSSRDYWIGDEEDYDYERIKKSVAKRSREWYNGRKAVK
jgi:hypothetical protein